MKIELTDHAILRYLERVKEFDVESIRKELMEIVNTKFMHTFVHDLGATAVKTSAYELKFRHKQNGVRLVTVITKDKTDECTRTTDKRDLPLDRAVQSAHSDLE